MTQAELQQLAASVGFPDPALAAAVAMAESSGNPRAFNGRGGDQSYGLWQINMIGALGPERRRAFGLSQNEDLFDPTVNARAALAISGGGTNWRPWGAYTNGSYRRFLGTATGSQSSSGASGQTPLLNLPPINTPFGPLNPVWIGVAVVAYLILK